MYSTTKNRAEDALFFLLRKQCKSVIRIMGVYMVLLDTNVFYRLCGIEKDDRYDLAKLASYVKKHECRCSWFSYFEILNSKLSFEDKAKILKYINVNKIHI